MYYSKGVVPGGAGGAQILADQLTLSQPGGTDYAYLITTGTPGFSDFPTALYRYAENSFSIKSKDQSNGNFHRMLGWGWP